MSNFKILLLLTLAFFSKTINVKAQDHKIDSINNVLKTHKGRDTIKVNLLNQLAHIFYYSDTDKIFFYAAEANIIAAEINFLEGKAESFKHLGVYNSMKSNYNESIESFTASLRIAKSIDKKTLISSCYTGLGNVYYRKGKYLKAIDYHIAALKIAEEIENFEKVSFSYLNIGNIYYINKDYLQAITYYEKALLINIELNKISMIAKCKINIASVYGALENYTLALKYFEESLQLVKGSGDVRLLCTLHSNIGETLRSMGDVSQALEHFDKAISLTIKSGLKSQTARAYHNKSNLYLEGSKYSEANYYAKKAYEIAEEIGNNSMMSESSKVLAESALKLGNYKEAYKFLETHKLISDSLFSNESIKQLTTLKNQFAYDTDLEKRKLEQEKKDVLNAEKEKRQRVIRDSFIIGFILLLLLVLIVLRSIFEKRKDNKRLAQQNELIEFANTNLTKQKDKIQNQAAKLDKSNLELSELIATKDKFFTIISHDLRNPFNTLLGFSDILIENNKNYNEEEREKYLKVLNKTTNKTYKLLGNLLTWSKSQTGAIKFTPKQLNVKAVIGGVIDTMYEIALLKHIEIEFEVDSNLSIYADKNMLKTIIRNLLSNAIKFTQKRGRITIMASLIEGIGNKQGVKITIKDTGVGMTSKMQSKIFDITESTSTKGTENEKGTGLGLLLCKEFINRHKGEIKVESEIGKGSIFYITIPN